MNTTRCNNTTRSGRLMFSIFAPPAIGSLLFIAPETISSLSHNVSFDSIEKAVTDLFHAWIVFTAIAYSVMGIQSIVAALTMEFVIRPRATNRAWFVFSWIVLGGLSGATQLSVLLFLIGIVTGLIVGVCMVHSFQPSPNPSK